MAHCKTGLVLNGGGTKGVAQLGAIKRLNEIGFEYDGIVGSSIGSVNAVLAYTGQMDKALQLYQNIGLSTVIPNDKLNESKNAFAPSNLFLLVKGLISSKGYSTSPFLNFLCDNLREFNLDEINPFNKAEIGIMTLQFSPRIKPVEIFLNGMNLSESIPYLVASMCFPFFKPINIGGKSYFDGGLYDVRPIHMLVERGYNNILCIDIGGIGRRRCLRKVSKIADISVIQIDPKIGLFDFDKERQQIAFDKGYRAIKKFIG